MKDTVSNVVRLPTTRQWAAAKQSALNADWKAYNRPADVDIRYGLSLIRARCREMAQNSDHAKGFLRIVRNNIVGAPGFVLQSRAARANGTSDDVSRQQVEFEWAEWGKRGNCEITGKYNWRSLQRHVIETVARDGEAFIRIVRPYNSRWGMTLQVIDPDAVDVTYNDKHMDSEIRMGVELDASRRPVAYWINGEPTIGQSSYRVGDRYRVPADEMVHVYLPEFAWQTRGVPWMATSAQRMHMIQGTEDAEVTATRASAAKFAAYEAHEWAPPPDETANRQLVDSDGNPISSDPGTFAQDVAPGMMEVVPYGYKLGMIDPQHPNAAMPDFLKWGLRSLATGMGVSYNTLGNDAEGVNYTSLRFFLGVERDHWMEAQDWYESDFPDPVLQAWTSDQIKMGTLVPRPGREHQLNNVHWQPRRWDGPDPVKQATADRQELENGTTTLTQIYARKGRDFDDAITERITELKRIKDMAAENGLTLAEVLPHMLGVVAEQPIEDKDDE